MVEEIEIEGYRSVRSVRMRMKPVLVVVGENGTGKTNLYRALQLFQAAASGNLARGIAEDGGMESVLWAGARKRGPVRMRIAATMDDFSYELELGLPNRTVGQASAFDMDPVVKRERVLRRLLDLARRAALRLTVAVTGAVDSNVRGARAECSGGGAHQYRARRPKIGVRGFRGERRREPLLSHRSPRRGTGRDDAPRGRRC